MSDSKGYTPVPGTIYDVRDLGGIFASFDDVMRARVFALNQSGMAFELAIVQVWDEDRASLKARGRIDDVRPG